jgi:hypothetical protein
MRGMSTSFWLRCSRGCPRWSPEEVADEGERIVVRARTGRDAAVCPVCGVASGRVHGYRPRTVADVPADTLHAWLREHPGGEVVCRDGSATYAEAIRRALPDAVQAADRWHVRHNLCEAALSEVKAHSTCWAAALDAPLHEGPRAQTTPERQHQVHDLLGQGVGLLGCARRLQLALNTVKRHARADRPDRMLRVPKYRVSLVDPYREHLRTRQAEDIGNFAELLTPRAGNADKLARWIGQARAVGPPHPHTFTRGLGQDRNAVVAALTLPCSDGPTEGINIKTKRIARRMHGRAGFTLPRHRIILG